MVCINFDLFCVCKTSFLTVAPRPFCNAPRINGLAVTDDTKEEDVKETESAPRDEGSTVNTSFGNVVNGGKGKKGGARCCHDEVDRTFCEYLKKSSTAVKIQGKQDDLDLFMQSMACTIPRLPSPPINVLK